MRGEAMNTSQVLTAVRAMGMTCRYDNGEYRVNIPTAWGGSEATAYYTNDADDAIGTARIMRDTHAQPSIDALRRDTYRGSLGGCG